MADRVNTRRVRAAQFMVCALAYPWADRRVGESRFLAYVRVRTDTPFANAHRAPKARFQALHSRRKPHIFSLVPSSRLFLWVNAKRITGQELVSHWRTQ